MLLSGPLEQVAAGADLECRGDGIVVVNHRQHEYGAVGARLRNPPDCLEARHAGHVEVHDEDVGGEVDCSAYSLLAVPNRPEHLYVVDCGEEASQAVTKERGRRRQGR